MLPPVDPNVLSVNPKFDSLYQDLCTNKLNPDGSSALDQKAQKERDIFAGDLRTARLEAAKRDLIKSELRGLAYNNEALPDDLQELVAITAATLDGSVPENDQNLVADYIDALIDNPARVAAGIENNLNRNITALSHAVTSKSKADPTQLPAILAELNMSIDIHHSKLATARLDISHEVTQTHELYKQILASSIRLLEQTIHGSVSRASKAKAEYLAIVAEGMAKKLGIQHQQLLSQVYSGEMQEELQERSAEVAREERSAKRKIESAQEKLSQYREGRGMEGMADEYAKILGETARVREEIARLESRQAV